MRETEVNAIYEKQKEEHFSKVNREKTFKSGKMNLVQDFSEGGKKKADGKQKRG